VSKRQNVALVSVIGALLIGAAWYQFGGHRTAPGQPPLAELNVGALEQLRADFNAAADQPRIILLLSPT
jgi:3-dehydroquinate dehydratase